MTQVSVTPESFDMVFYDAAVIGEAIVSGGAALTGAQERHAEADWASGRRSR